MAVALLVISVIVSLLSILAERDIQSLINAALAGQTVGFAEVEAADDRVGLYALGAFVVLVGAAIAFPVRFQCVAASIERASEHWFERGPLVDAVMASAAVPGILPAVRIGGEHYFDGGIVNSIPVSRAVELGARTLYVLHVGRLDRPLEPPRWPWEVGLVAFEIARRHRFLGDLARLPDDVTVHVLPTGQTDPPRYNDLKQLRYRDGSQIAANIARAREATAMYLDENHAA